MVQSSNNKHLVLHLDVNETILVGDKGGGDTWEDCFNKIVAKSAFVKIPAADLDRIGKDRSSEALSNLEPTHWWDGTLIQASYPLETSCPSLWTEWEWPEGCCPYYRTKFKKRSKTFLSHHGSIYRETQKQMHKRLKVSSQKVTDTSAVMAHLLPAFFRTLQVLSSSEQRFTLVFRTMGVDLTDLAEAVNLFARGKHPDFPSFHNPNLVLSPHRLVKARWTSDGTYQLWKGGSVVASGDQQVLEFIRSESICGIQDDYMFWKQHSFEPWAGKPVWIEQEGSPYHHILFDDNIHNIAGDGIVGVRKEVCLDEQESKFQALSNEEVLAQHGKHLVRVPTVAAILDSDWLIKKIAATMGKDTALST